MNDLESLQSEPLWTLSVQLARILLELENELPCDAECSALFELGVIAGEIPRHIALAHVATQAEVHQDELNHALERARRLDDLLQLAAETVPDALRMLAEAFWRADQLRETIFLALDEDREIRQSA